MRYGANLPYDLKNTNEQQACINSLSTMGATEVTIASHDLTPWLVDQFKNIGIELVHIRAKTGPQNQGLYPIFILDYHEWDNETTLREAIQMCIVRGFIPHVILGNEPDIEMAQLPDDVNTWDADAKRYKYWYVGELFLVKLAFPGNVRVAPAPLSQGNSDRFATWFYYLGEVYEDAQFSDFIAEHCYLSPEGQDAGFWEERWRYFVDFGKDIHITEFDDNGTGRDATTYDWYRSYYEASGLYALSFFTLEGGANTRVNRPDWWFLTLEELKNLGEKEEDVGAMATIHDGFAQIWRLNGDIPYWTGSDFTGIFKVWSRNPEQYGSPLTGEFTTDDGRVVQPFARGLYEWRGGDLVKVDSGL